MKSENGLPYISNLIKEKNKNGQTPLQKLENEGATDSILQLWAYGVDIGKLSVSMLTVFLLVI